MCVCVTGLNGVYKLFFMGLQGRYFTPYLTVHYSWSLRRENVLSLDNYAVKW